MLKRRKPIICGSDKPEQIITQPNGSRTIRQILDDTLNGRPSPVPLTPLPEDAKRGISEKDMHELRVVDDKFDAINEQRKITREYEKKVFFNREQEKKAVEAMREENRRLRQATKEKKEKEPATPTPPTQ